MKNSTSKDRRKQWSQATHSKDGTLNSSFIQLEALLCLMKGAVPLFFSHKMLWSWLLWLQPGLKIKDRGKWWHQLLIQCFLSKIIFNKTLRCTNSNYLNFIQFWDHKYVLPEAIKQYVNWYFFHLQNIRWWDI